MYLHRGAYMNLSNMTFGRLLRPSNEETAAMLSTAVQHTPTCVRS